MLFMSLFFFSYSGDHRDLHSFPTRRSSDLSASSRASSTASPRTTTATCTAATRPSTPPAPRRISAAFSTSPRSEEHTSELQSLAYLVCRLLLEKKKKQNEVTNTSTPKQNKT